MAPGTSSVRIVAWCHRKPCVIPTSSKETPMMSPTELTAPAALPAAPTTSIVVKLPIDARQAERIGLVTRVVPPAELDQVSRDVARAVAGHPSTGVRYAKLGLDLAADVDFDAALVSEAEAEVTCFDTEDVRANIRAFLA